MARNTRRQVCDDGDDSDDDRALKPMKQQLSKEEQMNKIQMVRIPPFFLCWSITELLIGRSRQRQC